MLNEAIRKYRISPTESIMVGDKFSDVQAGLAAGVRSVLLTREEKETSQIQNEYLKFHSLTDLANCLLENRPEPYWT